MEKPAIALAIVLLLLLARCTSSTTPDGTNTDPPDNTDPIYTLQDLEDARLRGECWTAINGNVYNITAFVDQHPGGNIISEDCGKDSTTLFETRPMGTGTPHSGNAREILAAYYIGRFRGN
jgi:cytochrome b involved in lipid metabolism